MSQNLRQALDLKFRLHTARGKRVTDRVKMNLIQSAFPCAFRHPLLQLAGFHELLRASQQKSGRAVGIILSAEPDRIVGKGNRSD